MGRGRFAGPFRLACHAIDEWGSPDRQTHWEADKPPGAPDPLIFDPPEADANTLS
jgi:hypothetical protein